MVRIRSIHIEACKQSRLMSCHGRPSQDCWHERTGVQVAFEGFGDFNFISKLHEKNCRSPRSMMGSIECARGVVTGHRQPLLSSGDSGLTYCT